MNDDQFWKIIELSRRGFSPNQAEGNMNRQIKDLETLLSKLSPEEIIDFRDIFTSHMIEAFKWDLWGACFIIADGCSDDGFMDFRSWLISMGRQVFEKAISDAESLVDVASEPNVEDVFFEEFQYIPYQVYEKLTGCIIPEYAGPYPNSPAGKKWNENTDDLKNRFPKLWKKYYIE